jgi:hypothetical protein
MLVGVAPYLEGSVEGIAVGSDAAWDMAGWRVTDGEGTVHLPSRVLAVGQTAWFTNDLAAWESLQGWPAESWNASGRFQLSNQGEGLRLLAPDGSNVDAFAWGTGSEAGFTDSVRRTSRNLVYLRDVGWPDTDSPLDWATPRMHRIGESNIQAATFTVHNVTLYSSPDSSHEVLSRLIAAARERLHLHVYQFTSLDLAERLAEAKRTRGLDVQVLVDSSPVGFRASERNRETQALLSIQSSGGNVVLAGHGRYAYHHLKVLVADDVVAVQSENWVESGVPRDPSAGNRGWGVAVHDAALADWFAGWMRADREAWDTKPFDATQFNPLFDPVAEAPPRTGSYRPRVPPIVLLGAMQVTPIISPDMTQDPRRDPVAAIIDRAASRVVAQQLDLTVWAKNPLGWSSPDPLADALARAAARGLDVRAQAAAPFSNDDTGNQQALDWLSERGARTHVLDREGLRALHNKGVIADGMVLVGSMNGNHNSRSANREVGMLLESPAAAQWYLALFDGDWGGANARDVGVIERDLRGLPWAPFPSLLVATGVALYIRVRR